MVGRSRRCSPAVPLQGYSTPGTELWRGDLVWRVVDLSGADSVGGIGKKEIALHEEELQRAGRGFAGRGCLCVLIDGRFGLTAASAVILDSPLRSLSSHVGVLIGQVEKGARGPHGERLVAVEGEKPHAWPSFVIVDVSADIQLHEPRDPRQRRHESGADSLHEEGHHAEPSIPIKSIDVQPSW